MPTCAPRPDALFCALRLPQFGAQALAAYLPDLRGRPFVVAQQGLDSHKSAVWACSPEAEKLGIYGGMPLMLIAKRYRAVLIVERNREFERAVCEELRAVFLRYSPEVVLRDSGSAIINLSRTPLCRSTVPQEIAALLRAAIGRAVFVRRLALGLAASSPIAQIMARCARPDNTCICPPGAEVQTLAGLDVNLLPGVSPHGKERLKAYGVRRIGQVTRIGKEALMRRMGAEGEKVYALAGGNAAQSARAAVAPIKAETVLDADINDQEALRQMVRNTADKFCFELKRKNYNIERFTFTLTYTDHKKVQKTASLPTATNDFLTITGKASALFFELYQRRVAIKSMGLIAGNAQPETGQLSLFETVREQKQKALSASIVDVREKMDFSSVLSAACL
ncbi:MAG: hypothetical protein PHC61_08270 [Chitinivibrionales bacterium]|nr:hypothetical protein [Chitinivibrionales bacterium]